MADLKPTNTILDIDTTDFMEGFLAMCPMPMIPDPKFVPDPNKPEEKTTMVPVYTPENWLNERTSQEQSRWYRLGKQKIAQQAVFVAKKDIIQPIPKLNTAVIK